MADARTTAAYQAQRYEFTSRRDGLAQAARLAWRTDAFHAQVLHRVATWARARRVPAVPWLADRWALATAQVAIGPDVVIAPGLYLAHGQVRIEGSTAIGPNVCIFPWATLGPAEPGGPSPTVGPGASIGTGSQVLGGVRLGPRAFVGANAVVVEDVPAGATAVGVPARIVQG